MKKIISLALAILLALSLCACDTKDVLEEKYKQGYSNGYADAESSARSAYSEGYNEGYNDGISIYDDAYDEGYADGYHDGFDDGYQEVSESYFDGSGLKWQETPGSDCFEYIAYDPDWEILAVIFRSNNTRTYLYYDFTEEDWESFTDAESLGKYYNANIKGQFSGERIDNIDGTYFKP